MNRFSKYAALLMLMLHCEAIALASGTMQANDTSVDESTQRMVVQDKRGKNALNKEIKKDPAFRFPSDTLLLGEMQAIDAQANDGKDVFTFSEGQLDEDEDVIQGAATLTSSSDDYFLSEVGYLFSPMRFRIRAYENMYNNMYANGVLLNDAERGNFSYGMIGGLNDATRNREGATFLEGASFGYSSVGGASNINMRASQFAAGHKASLVGCNRNYLARAMYTYATGLMENGWAFAGSASYRWANEGVIEGTFYNSFGYFLSAQKIINDRHSISIATWGSPTERAQQGAATEETYWLANSHYYNPNWGYQNGEKRNARVVTSFEPTVLLTWDWEITRETKLTTSLAGKYSQYGTTALGWNGNAADPRPNYYQNLPSAAYDVWSLDYTPTEDEVADWYRRYDYWKASKANRQINWDYMYYANQQANETGGNALYYVEKRNNDQMMLNLSSVLNHEFNNSNKITIGLNLGTTKGMHYKTLDDLLGSDSYGADIDKFSVGDFAPNSDYVQNDVDHPGRIVKEGDTFGYDYDIYVNTARLFGQYLHSESNFQFVAGAHIDGTTMERYGNMRNGRAINNSKGSSGTAKFLGGGARAGLQWNINGNNTFSVGFGVEERAPLAYNSFVAPRMRNDFIYGLENEKVWSQEISYKLSYGPVTAKVTGYYTQFDNVVEQSAFYNDMLSNFTYLSMTGLQKKHYGIEAAIVYNITSALSVNFLGSIGEAEYTKDATGFLISENEEVVQNDKVYMKGAHIDGTPLTAMSLGVDYNINGWYLSANANYYDRVYIGASSYARLSSVVGEPVIDVNGNEVLNKPNQFHGDGGFLVDASIGKSIYLRGGKRLNINLMLQNILNNEDMITGGYEQNRDDSYSDGEARTYKFSKNPYLYYANAFNFYLNIGLRF